MAQHRLDQLSFLGPEAQPMAPIRRQYLDAKRQHPDAILFFRLGDFYETFEQDAETVARELELVLTSRELGRGERLPMAGIPAGAAEGYVARLIARGFKVAICEQVGEPARGAKLLPRQVVRVFTPGTLVEDGLLSAGANNYLAALLLDGPAAGLAVVDISTGQFSATQLDGGDLTPLLAAELARLGPAEVLQPEGQEAGDALPPGAHQTARPADLFAPRRAIGRLLEQLGAPTLEAVGLADVPLAARAAGALLGYLAETQPAALRLLDRLDRYSARRQMVLDPATRRGLELLAGLRSGTKQGALLGVLDRTRTPAGARLLRAWVASPLLDLDALRARQDAVAVLVEQGWRRARLQAALQGLPDLERLAARLAQRLLAPRECLALARALERVPELAAALGGAEGTPLSALAAELDPCPEVPAAVRATLADDPPAAPGEGIIRPGRSAELDELRALSGDARRWIADLERRERERTGVRGLKVGYNRVFGYYLEVSTAAASQPTDYYQRQTTGAATVAEHLDRLGYQRKQTLANAERYVTPELKEYEVKVQNAQEEIARLERALYGALLDELAAHVRRLLQTAAAVARLDALASLAEVAVGGRYVRPELDEGDAIVIRGGRHPVVEAQLGPGEFVPNDTELSCRDAQIVVLTGPNMAGKSTYLRQVALIVLLAQIGSFVPADAARIGLVDRIFARIGAQDDIASGRSTFMVEMTETAAILRAATPRSLVILDEIGRGTSTYDGVAIARAVVEHLHDDPRLGCKTVFATHYHELAELARQLPRVRAYRMDVLEEGDRVAFLHAVVPGGADRSFGVHVARLAGVPAPVTRRAEQILRALEANGRNGPGALPAPAEPPADDALRRELAALDPLRLTPLEALERLFELHRRAVGEA